MWYRRENDTVIVNIYVQPGAKRTEVAGFHGDAIKIRLASPPIDERANDALLRGCPERVIAPATSFLCSN